MSNETIKILIVDDSDLDYQLFSRMISKTFDRPHTTTNAENQRAMVSLLENAEKFDIILLDLGLPDSVEFDSIDEIRSRNKEIPIVVLSGTETNISEQDAKKMGGQEFVVKGALEKQTLSEVITRALD